MKRATEETIKLAADKMMFKLTDEECQNLVKDFEIIMSQMELIAKIEGVDDATPMTFPFEVSSTYLREDVAESPLSRDDALRNAKEVQNGQIKLPKVVK